MAPPLASRTGGSGANVLKMSAHQASRGSKASRRCSRGSTPLSSEASSLIRATAWAKARRSRGPMRPVASRVAMRSRSGSSPRTDAERPAGSGWSRAQATASCRSCRARGSRSGMASQRRRSRAPMGLAVASSTSMRPTPPGWVDPKSSRLRTVKRSIHRWVAGRRRCTRSMCDQLAYCAWRR